LRRAVRTSDLRRVFLPVVTRELQVRSRSAATRHLRLIVTCVVTAIVGLIALVTQLSRGGGVMFAGGEMFTVLGFLLLLFCLFEGVRNAAGGICDERREGTLGFLFLTDLTSLDVLLGKLAGAALNAAYSVLAVLPVLSLLLLFGGVTGGELLRIGVALLSGLALSLACGTWASTRSRDGMMAILLAFGLLLLICLAPVVLDLALLPGAAFQAMPTTSLAGLASPAISLALVSDVASRTAGERFWWSQAAQWSLAAVIVIHAAWHLRRTWRREEAFRETTQSQSARRHSGSSVGDVVGRSLSRRLRLKRWWGILIGLALLKHSGAVAMWFLGNPTTPAIMMPMQIPQVLASLALSLLVIYLAARSFAEARQTGEMEILLTTGLPDRQLVEMLWLRLRAVVISLIVIDAAFNVVGTLLLLNQPSAGQADFRWLQVLNVIGQLAGSVFSWWATVWTAMWFGLTTRKAHLAVGKTIGLVVIATGILTSLGAGLLIVALQIGGTWTGAGLPVWFYMVPSTLLTCGTYLCWIIWARRRLFTRFRQAAAETAS
jgi:hypothetical protein